MPFPDLPEILDAVPLAPRTTLGVGGAARYLARAARPAELVALLGWAKERRLPTFVLGGGSNLLVADQGFDGLVITLGDERIELERRGGEARVRVGAGADWDALVATTVDAGLGGLECLSGIPGRAGAAPIQNIGAYGQEVAEHLVAVEVVERATGATRRIVAEDCAFGYRSSRFKGPWRDRFVVMALELLLPERSTGTVRYRDLERHFGLGEGRPAPGLAAVREAVLEVRRSKSMVLDADDPNGRSAGSFFVNPVVDPATAAAVRQRHRERGGAGEVPAYSAAEGRVKLAAAWLIEQSGFARGHTQGCAGLSTRHTLALINRGGATAAEIVALAGSIRAKVRRIYGITLHPEPVFLGFEQSVDELLG